MCSIIWFILVLLFFLSIFSTWYQNLFWLEEFRNWDLLCWAVLLRVVFCISFRPCFLCQFASSARTPHSHRLCCWFTIARHHPSGLLRTSLHHTITSDIAHQGILVLASTARHCSASRMPPVRVFLCSLLSLGSSIVWFCHHLPSSGSGLISSAFLYRHNCPIRSTALSAGCFLLTVEFSVLGTGGMLVVTGSVRSHQGISVCRSTTLLWCWFTAF